MADQDQPNQNATKSKAEGDRPDENSVRNADRDESPVEQYGNTENDSDNAGGITNRPLSDEVSNQRDLPKRGTARDSSGDPNATQPEGDYGERDQ